MTRRGTTRRACPTCSARVLVGLDNDTAGIPVTVDANPVDNSGEALALMQGRRTFDLVTVRGSRGGIAGSQLEQRSASTIAHSTRLLRRPVHAEHRCDSPLPAAAVTATPTTWPEGAF